MENEIINKQNEILKFLSNRVVKIGEYVLYKVTNHIITIKINTYYIITYNFNNKTITMDNLLYSIKHTEDLTIDFDKYIRKMKIHKLEKYELRNNEKLR